MNISRTFPLTAAVAIGLVAGPAAGQSFQGLGSLHDGDSTFATDVSADGAVVVGYSYRQISGIGSRWEAFRWTQAGGMVSLGELPGGSRKSLAFGVSGDGSVVVGASDSAATSDDPCGPGTTEAFRWTQAGGMVGLGDLPPYCSSCCCWSEAHGVSANGSVVVGTGNLEWHYEAFRCTQGGGMVGLGGLPGASRTISDASAVSADGSVIVGTAENASYSLEAFRWAGGMLGLGDLPGGGDYSAAYDVSADGLVVVGHSESALSEVYDWEEAFRWTQAGGMVGLGDLPGFPFYSSARGVSGDGSVVVGYGTVAYWNVNEAFIWTEEWGMVNLRDLLVHTYGLNLAGWTLRRAYGVSADGRTIVGDGYNPSTGHEAWIARLAPIVCVVDPNDPSQCLMDSGVVSDDPNRLASGGRPVVGLAADGVTRVLIRTELPAPATVEFRLTDENGLPSGVGTLTSPGGDENTTTLSVTTEELGDGRDMAFAILTAPVDFARNPDDEALAERPINIEMTFTPDGGGDEVTVARQIDLVRPPVMLLHGIWSSRDTWSWALQSDSRFAVYRHDYEESHAYSFGTNVQEAREGVVRAVQMLRAQGIAATQADVIAHSMGGLLSRLHVADVQDNYYRDDNFREGDIHKLITLDTPHLGSPWADVLMAISENPVVGWWFNDIMRKWHHCVDCGAVADLRPNSEVLSNLPGAQVQAHVIVGVGGSDILQAGMESLLPLEMSTLLTILRFFGVLPEDLFPPALQHDLIVGRMSQEGGLGTGSSQTSVFGLNMVPLALGIHTTVTGEARLSDRAVELLNASVNSDEFASEFPPRGRRSNGAPSFVLPQQGRAVEDGIQIINPLPGTPVTPGTELSVTVQGTGGFVPVRVMVVSNDDAEIDEEAPFDILIDIPPNSIGEIRLGAFAFDANNNFAEADEVVLPVDVSASLTGISLVPETLYLFAFAPTQGVTVMGTYDDRVERDVTSASLGTTYETSDPEVATIDAEGVVTGHRVGSTIITATTGAHVGAAHAVVVTAFADYDRDRDVDLHDLAAFMTCFSGPAETPGFLIPEAACRDFFDTDADFDVDLDDFSGFHGAVTGPPP